MHVTWTMLIAYNFSFSTKWMLKDSSRHDHTLTINARKEKKEITNSKFIIPSLVSG